MKRLVFLFLLLFAGVSFGSSMAERRASMVPRGVDENMPRLVHYLTDNMLDKTDQALAIATWIASHIAYDYDANATYRVATPKSGQTADEVFKNRIGICVGFAELYEKMLQMANIKSEKVYGFVVEAAPTQTKAKMMVKKEKTGHVWTKIHIPGRKPLYVDVTWMARGGFGGSKRTRSEQARKREIRKNKRENKSYEYSQEYFDFTYPDLMQQGEYRFTTQRQLIKK